MGPLFLLMLKKQKQRFIPDHGAVFLIITGVILLLMTGCAAIPYDGPHPCRGYDACLTVQCSRDGRPVDDLYPEAALEICYEVTDIYDYHCDDNVRCVAQCLIEEEDRIQQKYTSCSKRNAARLRAHMKCYVKCVFVPTKGLPEEGPTVGWEMLWPDFWKNPLSLW